LCIRKKYATLNAWRETLAYAYGVFASEAVVRTWSINSSGSTGPISIVPGCPRERSRLISRGRSEKSVQMHNE
jgi:hypothetical protein